MTDVAARVTGPFQIRAEDLGALNILFADAFSERYRRDGLVGVRVPPLNPAIWRFAIDGAGEGAMLWRDGLGRIAAFNIAHVSGREGWMGPLAVREELQGHGLGRTIVRAAIDHMKAAGCTVIGLETMPRTMDNIGFYGGLGFTPAGLTVTVSLEAGNTVDSPPELLSRVPESERDIVLAECGSMSRWLGHGSDYTREIALTLRYSLGDLLVMRGSSGEMEGFALYHDAPLVEGRSREDLRVLKLVLRDVALLPRMAELLAVQARRSGTLRAAIRLQGEYRSAFRTLVSRGGKIRWTDLRMTLSGYDGEPVSEGLVLSNWEI